MIQGTQNNSHDPRPRVCMFVRNTFQHDNRVLREARTLLDHGFAVTVFAISNAQAPPGETQEGGLRIVRIPTPSAVSILVHSVRQFPSRTYRRVLRTGRALLRVPLGVARGVARRVAPIAAPAIHAQSLRLAHKAWPRLFRRPTPRGPTPMVPAAARGPVEKTFLGRLVVPVHRFFQTRRFGNVAGKMAAAARPVAYHCHDLNSVWAGWRGRRLWKAPIIYDSHELWPHRNRPDASWSKTFVLHQADKYVATRADGVVTVSASIADHMKKKYGVKDVVVVRNTPPLALRTAPPSHGEFSHLARPRFLYLGGILANRGLEQIIQALAHTSQGVLVAVGPAIPDFQIKLEALATTLGVRDRVIFPGKVPEASVVATAAQCDVGLSLIQNYCLSYHYSLPNKLFEYLHAGLPVLVSDFPDMRDLARAYDVGATCDPSDPRSIARGLDELAADPARIERFKRNAIEASKLLSWEVEQERLVALYRRLVPANVWPRRISEARVSVVTA